ncbi:sensor histidine kinase [Xanthomarina sp. F2636L]|uniref:sensor histidine kinase n=1 Tax=Xanthomarina sp. F2636L TaxID=2996018 RepID=UPI00225DD935|nr:histidine kinase [Xanthomarina sp. F2636L]MCX7549824.1 histidine kinase [Xanthomarina sp. F2636L]
MIPLINIFLQAQPTVSTSAERYLLIYMIGVLLIVTSLVVIFFIVFQKRKNKLLLDKIKQQQAFDEEIAQTQTEIQEQTLKHIGWELHDNVGQLLAYASMQLNMISSKIPEDLKGSLNDTTSTIKESLKEVRSLSKSLNNDVILNIGFEKSITNELDRLKRMKFASAELHIKGTKQPLSNKKHEIILFRILQEFFSNSVKYSEAQNLKVALDYSENQLLIVATDDGKGFDVEKAEKGSGLINMKSRAELIEAKFDLFSRPNEGVKLTITYPLVSGN